MTLDEPGRLEVAELLRRAIDLSGQCVLASDAEGRIVYANDAVARLVGADSGEELIGRPLTQYVRDTEFLHHPPVRRPITLTLEAACGARRHTVGECRPVVDDDCRSLGMVIFCRAAPIDEQETHAAFGLTPREAQIAADLLVGSSIAEIARTRAISHHTVRNHVKAIYKKTGAGNRIGLARAYGLIADTRRRAGEAPDAPDAPAEE